MEYKFGKKPFVSDERDLLYRNYRTATLPAWTVPIGGFTKVAAIIAANNWGMLGNDTVGDCVEAGADHETMMWTAVGSGAAALFIPGNTLADYSAETGYNPAIPASNQGTDVRSFLLYRQQTGVIDYYNNRHKLLAFMLLQTNIGEIQEALFLFDAVGIGFHVYSQVLAQFEAGEPWDVVAGAVYTNEDHYVSIIGWDGTHFWCVSWGKLQAMTPAFLMAYCDEAWALLSEEFLNKQGLSPNGFNFTQLQADLTALQNNVPVMNSVVLSGTVPTLTDGVPFDLSTLTVTALDQFGNNFPLVGVTPTWSTTAGTISGLVLTPIGTGTFTVQANVNGMGSNALVVAVAAPKAGTKIILMTIGSDQATVNGVAVAMDQPAVDVNGRVFVPVRFIDEQLGAAVAWNQTTQEITVTWGTNTLILTIGSMNAILNGTTVVLDVAPYIDPTTGRTLVPIRFIAQSMGAVVSWIQDAQEVVIVL